MKLHKLSVRDKETYRKYLSLSQHSISVYAFENIYIWKGLFEIYWAVIKGNLCIFFRDKIGCFLYLPPLAKHKNPSVIRQAFKIMDKFNKNKALSRIENVEAGDLAFYQKLGYGCQVKSFDYLSRRQDLAQLKGNKFKSKRASRNYFTKHYQYAYLPFSLTHKKSCLKLYAAWMAQRKQTNKDKIYQGMLEDSQNCLKILLDNYRGLDLTGRVVKIDNALKGFTFGFKLNKETFCILYEITDLSVKGLAQFIFSEFCAEIKGCKYINIMDDSGLDNLKQVKLSYHPLKLIPSYIIKRKWTPLSLKI